MFNGKISDELVNMIISIKPEYEQLIQDFANEYGQVMEFFERPNKQEYPVVDLAKEHNVDLVLCVAAAQRRGMLDEDEAKRNGKTSNNVADGFRISGLGQLIEAGIQADRMVVFGD